jgi:hypothetical protein
MLNLESLIMLAIAGVFTGLGSAIGNYFAQRAFIKHLEKIK